ncbi:hypothetical protein LCGC14_2750180, partial [marine sediment metagenome]
VNKTVTHIYLRDNNIGYKGAEAIAAALKVNKTVTQIDLRLNNIGDKGAEAIAAALKVNKTVTQISLRGNNIGDKEAEAIAAALKVNEKFQNDAFACAREGNSVQLHQLLEERVSLNGTDEKGNTLLHVAAKARQLQIVQLLLKSGASKALFNNKGETLLDIARKKGCGEIVSLLISEISELPGEIKCLVNVVDHLLFEYCNQTDADRKDIEEIRTYLQSTVTYYKTNPESQDFGETVERLKRYQRTLEDLITPREVLQFSVESSSS